MKPHNEWLKWKGGCQEVRLKEGSQREKANYTRTEPKISGSRSRLSTCNTIWKRCDWQKPKHTASLLNANLERKTSNRTFSVMDRPPQSLDLNIDAVWNHYRRERTQRLENFSQRCLQEMIRKLAYKTDRAMLKNRCKILKMSILNIDFQSHTNKKKSVFVL